MSLDMLLLMPRHAKVLAKLGTRFRHPPSTSTRSSASRACSAQEDHGATAAIAQRKESEARAGRVDLSMAARVLQSSARPCGYDLVRLIRAATTSRGSESHGVQLQSLALKRGFGSDVFVMTALMSFHVEKGSLRGAHNLFDEIPEPNVVSWNTLVSGYLRFGLFRKALSLFVQLNKSETCVGDAFSVTAALAACGRLSLLQLGRSIHSKIVKVGMRCSVFVSNCLIDMYGKCGCVQEAVRVFGAMCYKDTISWNSVLSACARNRNLEEALNFLQEMPTPDTISYNEVINGFAQFGNMEYAVQILLYMPKPNSSSWNSIITGYVNRNRSREALDFFTRMRSEGMEMDQFTFSSILSGIGSLAALSWGMAIHCCMTKCAFDSSVVVGSALVDMYSKCGQVEDAALMFDSLPQKNLITWNAMISGFAHNGYFAEVVHCFEQLLIDGIEPDEITFLNVLSAFSHGGVPSQLAMKYLESMINDYRIHPTAEHGCSIIRLMGQRGEVRMAGKMIHKLGFSTWASVWRTLLGACGSCRDLETAKIAAAKLIQLEGDEDYIYVAMSNIYASHGKWSEAGAVRELMRSRGVRKGVGFSWIQVKNVISNSDVA